MIENKAPSKDISKEDILTKFPLASKKEPNHFSTFEISGIKFGPKYVPVFAGPNMVESKELILDCAKNLKNLGASFLRAGAFKPLTFPYRSKKYNETREAGIEWLNDAKKTYKKVVKLNNAWRDTQKIIKQAEKAHNNKKYDKSMDLAKKALNQAKMAIEQHNSQKDNYRFLDD